MCGIVSATVQTFFAWRIHRLSKSRILASCIIVLASVQVMASIVAGVLERKVKLASEVQGGTMKAAAVWLAGSAAADMLIAVSMVVLLLRRKSGIARTDALINRMVRLVVETGSLTAGFSILVIIFAICAPLRDTLVYQTPALVLTKLYSNTLLTNLNSRDYIRKREQYVVELAPVGSGKPVHHAAAQHGTSASTPVSFKSDTSIGAHDARLKGPSAEKYTLPPATDHVVRQGRMDDAAPRDNLRARRNSVV